MDASQNREEDEPQGAAGPLGSPRAPPVHQASDSDERWDSDADRAEGNDADASNVDNSGEADNGPEEPRPARAPPVLGTIHHYHHFHCPDQPCETASRPPWDVDEDEIRRRDARIVNRVVNEVVHTFRSEGRFERCSGPFRAHSPGPACRRQQQRSPRRGNRSPPRGHSRPARHDRTGWARAEVFSPPRRLNRSRSPNHPRSARYSEDWVEIEVLSPRRGRGNPCQNQSREFVRNVRQGISTPPIRSPPLATPPRPRNLHLSPTGSPSALGARAREVFPQFTDEQRRRTRNHLLRHMIGVRLTHRNLSSVGGWRRFVQSVQFAGTYGSQADISLAWNIAFEQPVQAHFTSLWDRDPNILALYLPRQESVQREDLVHF